jgi:hypothetical protein
MFKKLFGSRKKVSAPTTLPSPQVVSMNELDYDPKIVVAWAKAIEGNKEITNWLYENGFKELCFAIQFFWKRYLTCRSFLPFCKANLYLRCTNAIFSKISIVTISPFF